MPGVSAVAVTSSEISRPVCENRCALASVRQTESRTFVDFMEECNGFSHIHELRVFKNWSKIWEYPWLWENGLRALDWSAMHLVDIGSELSPFPWLAAKLGAKVTFVEQNDQWIHKWESLRDQLRVDVEWMIVGSEQIPLPENAANVVTSFSVIEHQVDKRNAINEIARILKPGGVFAISFDVCEPEMGMTFPEWNGRAVTLKEFEELIWFHPAFGNSLPPRWNREDIPAFLHWHRLSAPHHDYIVGAAILYKHRNLPPEKSPQLNNASDYLEQLRVNSLGD
jgi:SAM-dependent methyltransferase